MADEGKKGGGASASPVETKVSLSPTTSVMMGELGADKPKAKSSDGAGTSVDLEDGKVSVKTGFGEEKEEEGDETKTEEGSKGEGGEEGESGDSEGGEDTEESGDESLEDLGEYDPASDEVVSKFDAAYRKDDGSLNVERISKEWAANAAKNEGDGTLNEGTYAYLQDQLGIPKEYVKDIEAGLVARGAQMVNAMHERAGGKETFDAALEWGRKGGYTKAQRDRFNKVLASGDQEAINDAIDALVVRHGKATGRRTPQQRRPASPQRDVTRTAAQTGVEGYPDYADYQKEFRAARKDNDQEKLNMVRKRLKASHWYKKR